LLGVVADLAEVVVSAHTVVLIAAAEAAIFPVTPTLTVMARVVDLIVSAS